MSEVRAPGTFGERIGGLRPRTWLAVACGLHLLLGLLLYEPTLFPGGDNAGYMILGKALRTFSGYRDLYLPGSPLHAKYPPFYPLVLAVLGWVGGLQLFKVASLLLTTGAVALVGFLGRRWLGTRRGLLAALVVAVNPVLLEYSHYVLSEAPFVALVLLALWALEEESSWPYWAGLLVAMAAFLTRTAGLPLLAAAVLAPAAARRWREAGLAAAISAVAAGGWALYQHLAAPAQASYLRQLVMANPYAPGQGTIGIGGLLARGAGNSWTYVSRILPGSLTGGPAGSGAPGAGGTLLTLAGVAVTGLALTGWILRAVERVGPAELFALFYAALIALWPSVWTDRRFLLPLLPLLLLYALGGASAVADRLVRRPSRRKAVERETGGTATRAVPDGRTATVGALLIAAALAVPGVLYVLSAAPGRIRCVADYRAGTPCEAPALASFLAAARWARTGTPPDAVIANRKPRLFYLVSGRRGDVYRFTKDPDFLLAGLDAMRARYVVVDALSGTTELYLLPAIRSHADRFGVVYRGGDPPTWVLSYRPTPGTALGPTRPGPIPDGPAPARVHAGGPAGRYADR